MAGGEDGPGDAEGEYVGGRVIGYEDMFVAEPEIEGEFWIRQDIANAEACGGAGEFLVGLGAIGVVNGLAGGVEAGDISGADAIAAEGFEVEACAAMVEGVAVAKEKGDEDHVRLVWREVVEADLAADLVAFRHGEADVKVGAEPGGGVTFSDELGYFELGVDGGACTNTDSNKE